jgi:hypothetical protein
VTFRNLDVDSVGDAIGRAVSALPQLAERAAQAAPAWRRHDSPVSLVDQLLAFVSHAASQTAAPST